MINNENFSNQFSVTEKVKARNFIPCLYPFLPTACTGITEAAIPVDVKNITITISIVMKR